MTIANTLGHYLGKVFGARAPAVELSELYGTYRGFSPTDESPIAMGELELSLSHDLVEARMATGLKIESDSFPTQMLSPMSKAEIYSEFLDGSSVAKRTVGFSVDGIRYLFVPNAKDDELGLIIRGGLGDFLGPTILFSPAQIERGLYDKTVEEIEKGFGGKCIPTLALDGRLPEEYLKEIN